tara:strand:+ start:809 stop:1225 length:417 start_codon:yes stop_codon:yes gene_type:complete
MARAKFIKPAIQDQPTRLGPTSVVGNLSITGIDNVSQSIAEGIVGNFTVSSSFTSTLAFTSDKIMSTTVGTAVTMSIDADKSILGKVIMADISSSVGLHLTGSEFKVLNGTFDTTKRNYVYYHYIGNDTALVTINQES